MKRRPQPQWVVGSHPLRVELDSGRTFVLAFGAPRLPQLVAAITRKINPPIQFVSENLPVLERAIGPSRTLRQHYRELLERALNAGLVQAREIEHVETQADISYLDAEGPHALEQTRHGVQRVATIVRALKSFAHPDRGMAAWIWNKRWPAPSRPRAASSNMRRTCKPSSE